MTEKYLHYLWKSKQFPLPQTLLTTGEEIIVKDVGEYNENLKGPDFSFGSVQFAEVVEYGPIEIHINSSDWYAHNHHLDANYDNVILHVVYKNDKQVVQNGRPIPTLELKEYVEQRDEFKCNVNHFFRNKFPCSSNVRQLDSYFINNMLNSALRDKLMFKASQVAQLNGSSDLELFYHYLALSFGMKINQEAFIELINKISFDLLLTMSKLERRQFVLLQADLLMSDEGKGLWHKKGTRPSSFPKKKVLEFAELISNAQLELNWWADIETINLSGCRKILSNLNDLSIVSRQFENSIIINAFVPFLWNLGEKYSNELYQEKALEILSSIPAEVNSEVSRGSNLIEKPKNAFETQGLIALVRYYCSRKKCLSCHVGNKILNRDL